MKRSLVALALLGSAFLLGLGIASLSQTQDKVDSLNCLDNLTVLSTCLHKYHEKYGHFPPAYVSNEGGFRMHSWRVLLLEFVDPDLYAQYDFQRPWNDPVNKRLEMKMPSCYRCKNATKCTPTMSTYFVIVGEATVFPGPKTVALRSIANDWQRTILVAESTTVGSHWMEPVDLCLDQMSFVLNDASQQSISSRDVDGPA